MNDVDKFIDEKIREIAREENIVDLGGGKPFMKWMAKYKNCFRPGTYKTFDCDFSVGADIVGDIHSLPFPGATVDAFICSSVLEHVKDPNKAISEIYRALKKGGKLFVYVPSVYPYHAKVGFYGDYWRFFDDTIDLLFVSFAHKEIKKRGGYFKALSFFLPYQNKLMPIIDPVSNFLDKLFKTNKKNTTAGYYIYAVK